MTKPPNPNPPTSQPHNPTPADPNWVASYKLDGLAQLVGPAPADLLPALLADTTDNQLVEMGRRIETGRIVTDGARLYGIAYDFIVQANREQKQRLRGFSTDLLALGVHQALALERMKGGASGQAGNDAMANTQNEETLRSASITGLALRDQVFDLLRDAAVQNLVRRKQVELAVGTAANSETLETGIRALAGLLRDWLAQKDDPIAVRLRHANLDATYVAELEEAAARIKKAGAASHRRRKSAKVSQGQLDRADGINLLILGQVIRAFERAHHLDATIPRLIPIATRRMFSHAKKTPQKTPAPPSDGGVTA